MTPIARRNKGNCVERRRPWGGLLAVAARAAVVAAITWVGPAFAGDPAETPDATFARGLASFEAGRTEEAIATWEALARTLGESGSFRLLYNLGLAYEKAGDGAAAIERFDAFLKQLAAEPKALTPDLEERRQDAAERSKALKAKRGAVVLPKAPAGDTLARIDGGAARSVGFTSHLLPGEHTIELIFGPGEARKVRIRVEAGTEQTVDTSRPAPGPHIVVVQAPLPPAEMPVGLIVAGGSLTVLSFGLPIGLGIQTADLRAQAVDLGRGHSDYAAAAKRYSDARTAYATSYLLPGVLGAATLVVAGIGLQRVLSASPPGKSAAHVEIDVGLTGAVVRGVW